MNFIHNSKNTPVGYTIYIPHNFRDRSNPTMVTMVYGGSEEKQCSYDPDPKKLDELSLSFLSRGLILATLNTPEILSPMFQLHMTQDTYDIVQISIHEFIKQFRTGNLYSNNILDIQLMNKLNVILYGASFGGGIVMKHAELYPKSKYPRSYDGYYSHAGLLNLSTQLEQETFPERVDILANISDEQKKMLTPNCAKIEEPIFLNHNYNDNTAHIFNSRNFYQGCVESGKENIQINFLHQNSAKEYHNINTGHMHSLKNKNELDDFESFVRFGKNSSQNEKHFFESGIYPNRDSKIATPMEKAISQSFRWYMKNELKTQKHLYFNDSDFNSDVENIYNPIFYCFSLQKSNMLAAMQSEIRNLNLPMDDSIVKVRELLVKALNRYLPLYLKQAFITHEYKEHDIIDCPQNEKLQEKYNFFLNYKGSDRNLTEIQDYFFRNFCLANLELAKLAGDQCGINKNELDEYKKRLEETIKTAMSFDEPSGKEDL